MNPSANDWKQHCQTGADAPLCDNPSGFFCAGCREIGQWHCHFPDECGGMRPMKRPPQGCERHSKTDSPPETAVKVEPMDFVRLVYFVPSPALGERLVIGAFVDLAWSTARIYVPARRKLTAKLIGDAGKALLDHLTPSLATIQQGQDVTEALSLHLCQGTPTAYPVDWQVGAQGGKWLRDKHLPR